MVAPVGPSTWAVQLLQTASSGLACTTEDHCPTCGNDRNVEAEFLRSDFKRNIRGTRG